jgi:hypothetical protein
MNMRRILEVAASLSLTAALGCAGDVTTIDRTQPNAIDKTMFEGIWYHRATVVGTDPESGDTEGITSGTDKLRWEIQENLLIGYRSYEFVPYAEGLTDEGRDFFGSPVVAFPIVSHFDIQRDYNPTTGVENNVIVENTTDRPWYERRFMRVNWSQQLVGSKFYFGWPNYPTGYYTADAIGGYYTEAHEETNPDRPVITKDYFDITVNYHVAPDRYYCNMMLLYNGVPRCGAGNVKVRVAFKKIDPADDYESLYYPDVVELKDDSGSAIILNFDGRRCDDYRDPGECNVQTYPMDAAFGNFRVARMAWDKERLLTRTGRLYQVGRFDIWEDSYADDGSLRPHAQRTPKPIVYYGNVNFPQDMVEHATKMAAFWNKPYMETVAFLQGKLTADGQADVARLRNELGQDMYQFRVNDCNLDNVRRYASENGHEALVERLVGGADNIARGNLEKVCAAIQYADLQQGKTLDPKDGRPMAFTWQRTGDLRNNFVNYVDPLNTYGPWGVAQFAQDPETGEFFSNAANYFAVAGDSVSQSEVDVVQWLNGDLSEEELFRGDFTRNEVVSRRQSKNNNVRSVVRQMLAAHEQQMIEESGDALFTEEAPGADDARFQRMFKGTDIERELLVNDELLRAFAGPTLYQPFATAPSEGSIGQAAAESLVNLVPGEVSDEALAEASPVNFGISAETNPFEKVVRELGSRGYELAEFFDPNSSGLAAAFKGEPRDKIYEWMRKELFVAVEAHEIGHTLGLRHNFQGSMDAINYLPQFWFRQNGDGSIDQFWNNPPNERNAHRGNEYKYSSVMDYGFDVPQEGLHGIGPYDEAAIRFFYGQLVHVWDPQKVSIPDPRKYSSWARRCGHDSNFWGLPALLYWLGPESIPSLFSSAPVREEDGSLCVPIDPNTGLVNYDIETRCDSEMDKLFRELVVRMEASAVRYGDLSNCALYEIADVNDLLAKAQNLFPDPSTPEGYQASLEAVQRIHNARKLVPVKDMIAQQIARVLNAPEYDNVDTQVDESKDGFDDDGDGQADDKGFDWSNHLLQVEYAYCADEYAGWVNPWCQRWDTGWDFEEATDYHINRYDRDYIFDHFRRDKFTPGGWGNPRAYMARLESRRLMHFTNVFRFYLYTQRTAFQVPLYEDWRKAAYKGVNILERIIQTPEPGRYCLNTATNQYELDTTGTRSPCNEEFTVGLGYGAGKYLNTSWTNEYFYKANRIGAFYDKWAAIRHMTSSNGLFYRDLSDLFDRRAFSLGYIRVWDDPIIQRFHAMISGDHKGYMSAVASDENGKYVRYMPFFDEEYSYGECTTENATQVCTVPNTSCNAAPGQVGQCVGGSVRESLRDLPKIPPSWSWSLQFLSLAYAISNFSSINDSSPEFYRFTKIAIKGTPEDVSYPAGIRIVEFTDPETLVTYRAPEIESRPPPGLVSPWPAYYGDTFHKRRGEYRQWGVGASLLQKANAYYTDVWLPRSQRCPDRSATTVACQEFAEARRKLNEMTGYIDIVRRFNRAAELP